MENPIDKFQDRELEELKLRLKEKEEKLDREIKDIKDILKPLTETYTTAVVLGKWIMGTLVFISVLIGIILGLKNLFK